MSWLTVKIGRFIHSALSAANTAKVESTLGSKAYVSRDAESIDSDAPQTQFTIIKAENGKLLKVSQYTRNTKSLSSDWSHEIWIIKDGEKVPDVIARIMAIKSLEQ